MLTADKAVLRDDARQGFVMMQRYGGSLIAMGDPVGPDVARALIWRFREEADRRPAPGVLSGGRDLLADLS